MRSICLLPYAPWPPHSGAKLEMMKHLNILKELGECTIVSARNRPVGFGWSQEAEGYLNGRGFKIVFREQHKKFYTSWLLGISYALFCKTLGIKRGFGHSNPYHRYAFNEKWWTDLTRGYDLAVMQYGYWSRFLTHCPKIVVTQELLSNFHRGGFDLETKELKSAEAVVVVGYDEKQQLVSRGLKNVLWSPPIIAPSDFYVSSDIALLGTAAEQNVAGLRWLESAMVPASLEIKVYGALSAKCRGSGYRIIGRYNEDTEPYQQCGIHLMTRGDRPGLQIKVVEALAAGRAIVARKGSMRGLPHDDSIQAWIEVDTPDQMLVEAKKLQDSEEKRVALSQQAKAFYQKYLDHNKLDTALRSVYKNISKT